MFCVLLPHSSRSRICLGSSYVVVSRRLVSCTYTTKVLPLSTTFIFCSSVKTTFYLCFLQLDHYEMFSYVPRRLVSLACATKVVRFSTVTTKFCSSAYNVLLRVFCRWKFLYPAAAPCFIDCYHKVLQLCSQTSCAVRVFCKSNTMRSSSTRPGASRRVRRTITHC